MSGQPPPSENASGAQEDPQQHEIREAISSAQALESSDGPKESADAVDVNDLNYTANSDQHNSNSTDIEDPEFAAAANNLAMYLSSLESGGGVELAPEHTHVSQNAPQEPPLDPPLDPQKDSVKPLSTSKDDTEPMFLEDYFEYDNLREMLEQAAAAAIEESKEDSSNNSSVEDSTKHSATEPQDAVKTTSDNAKNEDVSDSAMDELQDSINKLLGQHDTEMTDAFDSTNIENAGSIAEELVNSLAENPASSGSENSAETAGNKEEESEFDLDTIQELLMSAEHISTKDSEAIGSSKLLDEKEKGDTIMVDVERSGNHEEILAQLSSLLHPEDADESMGINESSGDVIDALTSALGNQEEDKDEEEESSQIDINLFVSAIQSALEEAQVESRLDEDDDEASEDQRSTFSKLEIQDALKSITDADGSLLLDLSSSRRKANNGSNVMTADERERVRIENRERKKRWRGQNMDRNRDNDLRGRVTRRATQIYGPTNTPQKMKWIEAEFQSRKLKRLERGVIDSFSFTNFKGSKPTNPVQSVMPEGAQQRFGSTGAEGSGNKSNTPDGSSEFINGFQATVSWSNNKSEEEDTRTTRTTQPSVRKPPGTTRAKPVSSGGTNPSFFASRGAKAPTPLPMGGIVTSFKLKTNRPAAQKKSHLFNVPKPVEPINLNNLTTSDNALSLKRKRSVSSNSSSASSLSSIALYSAGLIPPHLLPPDVSPVPLPKPLPFNGPSSSKRPAIVKPSFSSSSSIDLTKSPSPATRPSILSTVQSVTERFQEANKSSSSEGSSSAQPSSAKASASPTPASASPRAATPVAEDKRVRAMGFPPILTGMTLRR
ncbi:hypothetical protein D0Z00_003441 [Geotrichum galactomycetum]|uniref:Uncharacterized protein n=1 Tax=Geotrichum galactomycetum TaxID=27317 RepID=A0ACB6V173_9ASCO|nr:hypothetical protein D0Z00_003441 [Geotrichum candidum]